MRTPPPHLLAFALLAGSVAAIGNAWLEHVEARAAHRALADATERDYLADAERTRAARPALQPAVDDPQEQEFDSVEFNEVIGIGGGAGGRFGGRFGGRRNLRAAGGRSAAAPAGEEYLAGVQVGFRDPRQDPYSTFSVDVDTASFTNVRRFLDAGELPPPDAVRVEELLNAFEYDYPEPTGEHPLAIDTEVASCPWNPNHRLLRVALQAARVDPAERKPVNLVFLIDVSGSMKNERKLPLVVDGLKLLTAALDERDTVAIVTYASSVAVPLDTTPGHHADGILAALDALRAGGSTNGEGGIQTAYALAERAARPGAESRVILATDGDFNVGVSDRDALVALVAEKARAGVSLTVLGYGMGNLKDATLEQIADNGDGQYAYVDSEQESRRLFVDGVAGTLITAAQDVKLQVEFNPVEVASYRLVGYANRRLADEEFNDDAQDAGDVGVGQAVTALYELVPTTLVGQGAGVAGIARGFEHGDGAPPVDATRYQTERALAGAAFDGELATIKVRYKAPGGTESQRFEHIVRDAGGDWTTASLDLRFAAAVAMFGEALAGSELRGSGSLDRAQLMLLATTRNDPRGDRTALLELTRQARALGAR